MIKEYFTQLPQGLQEAVTSLCQRYQEAGYECIVVGGSLRDLLLGLAPKDFDFATNCPIETTKKLFPKVILTGVQHGTVTLLHQGYTFEVTLFRKDVKNFGRKAEVEYGATWTEDQERRDLTINALGYNPSTHELFDSQGAMADFKAKVIRFVGSAAKRVEEDHLRYLRFLRFIVKFQPLGITFEEADLTAAREVFDPTALSVERIYDEFQKVFLIPEIDVPFLVKQLKAVGLFGDYAIDVDAEEKMLERLFTLGDLVAIPFFILPCFKGNPADLRLPKKKLKLARILLDFKGHDFTDPAILKSFLAQLNKGDELEAVRPLHVLLSVDVEGEVLRILKQKEPFRIEDLAVSAKEIIELGFSGRSIGEIQKYLIEKVRKTPDINSSEGLTSLIKSYKKNLKPS